MRRAQQARPRPALLVAPRVASDPSLLPPSPAPPSPSPSRPSTRRSDQFFGNVCELDLVFNFNKVYMILDEFFLAGEVQETSKQAILHRVQELDKAD